MLTRDHERRPHFQLEHSDFRAHYENVSVRTLRSIGRRWWLIVLSVALAMALAGAIIPLMPRKYSATALVYPSLFSDEQGKTVPKGSVDASSIVIGEARLISSDGVLRAAAAQLGLDLEPDNAQPSWWSRPSWWPERLWWPEPHQWPSRHLDWLRVMYFPETYDHSAHDRAVAILRNKVEIAKDTRSYVISISYAARSADEAAKVVNTIVLEYLWDKVVQRRQDAVAAARNELTRLRSVFGDKHPKVLQAVDELDAARTALAAAANSEGGSRDAIVNEESVKLAIPNRTPTSPKGLVILGLSTVLGLLAGVGATLWRDRRHPEPPQFVIGHPQLDRRSRGESEPSGEVEAAETPRARRRRAGYAKRKNGVGHQLPPPETAAGPQMFPPER